MPKIIPEPTDLKLKNAKPTAKPYKIFVGDGLFLHVFPNGSKLWKMKYRFGGKEKLLSFGSYPNDVSLADAKALRDNSRKQIKSGVDPGDIKKAEKASQVELSENTFQNIAREWFERFRSTWAESHATTIIRRLEKDIFPYLGESPIREIKPSDLLEVLRKVEARGAIDTAHREKTICSQIFRYAIAAGKADIDPSANLRGALQPVTEKHYSAIIEPSKIAELLRAIDGYQGTFIVKCALKLAPLFIVRPGELRHAEWADIDFEEETWKFTASKKGQPHIVHLADQALTILQELYKVTGHTRYLFPSVRTDDRPMSENTVNAALRRMGFEKDEMTGHGFRAMARTILDEVLQIRPDFIEHQLAHAVKDPLGRAYNRTSHLEERRKMMQKWADYLDGLKAGAKVLPFKSQTG